MITCMEDTLGRNQRHRKETVAQPSVNQNSMDERAGSRMAPGRLGEDEEGRALANQKARLEYAAYCVRRGRLVHLWWSHLAGGMSVEVFCA